MNRLILIGNGFDLAHGLKTSYNDFILWYLKKCFDKVDFYNPYEDELLKIEMLFRFDPFGDFHNFSDIIDYFFEKNIHAFLINSEYKIENYYNNFSKPYKVTIKSGFFNSLLIKCKNCDWVNIENEFHEMLKRILNSQTHKKNEINKLNASMGCLIVALEEYLKTLKATHLRQEYSDIFSSEIQKRECVENINEEELILKDSLILNFNYTDTPEFYFKNQPYLFNQKWIKVNYIHGKLGDLKNPLIFGFGDELDEDYLKMEKEKVKGFFEYIKSFGYFRTKNYHELVRFLDQDIYQVYIMGHSCGLSDRTMLNMIFEHRYCKSIKIFYHETAPGENNFKEITQEISRHFKNKAEMRKKIVNFEYSEKMVQIN